MRRCDARGCTDETPRLGARALHYFVVLTLELRRFCARIQLAWHVRGHTPMCDLPFLRCADDL